MSSLSAPSDGSVLKMRAASEALRKAAGTRGSSASNWPFAKTDGEMRSRASDMQGITAQVAEWDTEMDNIDRKQEQLLTEQWSLFRSQIASMMGAIEALRSDIVDIKENAVMKTCWPDIERVIENMVTAHDQHGKNHDHILRRVDYLENFIGENFDKHAQNLDDHNGQLGKHRAQIDRAMSDLGEHRTTMETRLEYLEKLIGDSSDKHAKEIGTQMGRLNDLHAAVSSCATREMHNGVIDRVKYVERVLGESLEQPQNEPITTLNVRLTYLETLIGDNAERHQNEIASATTKLGDLREALLLCATKEHSANLEQRMAYLEKFFCESVGEHEKEIGETKKIYVEHKNKMETHLEYIEQLLRVAQRPAPTSTTTTTVMPPGRPGPPQVLPTTVRPPVVQTEVLPTVVETIVVEPAQMRQSVTASPISPMNPLWRNTLQPIPNPATLGAYPAAQAAYNGSRTPPIVPPP